MMLMMFFSFRLVWHWGHRVLYLGYRWPHRQQGLYQGSFVRLHGSPVLALLLLFFMVIDM